MKRQRGQRISRHVPYGSQLAAGGTMLEPYASEQRVIARVHTLWQDGLSSRKIAAALAKGGILSRAGTPFGSTAILAMVALLPPGTNRVTFLPQRTKRMAKPGRPKVYTSETQPYSLTIRIPRELFDQMERYTGRQGRSRTDAIVEGLKLWLERKAASEPQKPPRRRKRQAAAD